MKNVATPNTSLKAMPAALDGSAYEDSGCRRIVSDLPVELAIVAGEATLLFAHLRDLLGEVPVECREKE